MARRAVSHQSHRSQQSHQSRLDVFEPYGREAGADGPRVAFAADPHLQADS